jgi:hypothetical protein
MHVVAWTLHDQKEMIMLRSCQCNRGANVAYLTSPMCLLFLGEVNDILKEQSFALCLPQCRALGFVDDKLLDLMTLLLDMLHLRMIDGIPFVGYMA